MLTGFQVDNSIIASGVRMALYLLRKKSTNDHDEMSRLSQLTSQMNLRSWEVDAYNLYCIYICIKVVSDENFLSIRNMFRSLYQKVNFVLLGIILKFEITNGKFSKFPEVSQGIRSGIYRRSAAC